ncbi:MAG: thioredoxin-like domain-containing protein [Candidatus Methylacidiphilales bacterium]|nr:thioredoxin-like domain-containing protein [Candidatus Methylacidiphilales bacterium]
MRSIALLGTFLLLLVSGAALVIYSQGPVKLNFDPLARKKPVITETADGNGGSGSTPATADKSSSGSSSSTSTTANSEPRHPSLKGLESYLYRLNGNDIASIRKDETRVRYVLVYFSAHWCPPCRAFTPQLVSFYNAYKRKAREKNKSFEVVFVSNDQDESGMMTYSSETGMKWLAMKPGEGRSSSLASLCGPGIPCLVLLGPAGEVVSSSYANGIRPAAVMQQMERLIN